MLRNLFHFNLKHFSETNDFFCLVCLYFFLLFSSGFYFRAFNGTIAIAILYAVCGLFFCRNRDKLKFHPVQVFFFSLICVIFFMSSLNAGDEVKYIGINFSYLLVAFFFSNVLPEKKYFENYTKIMNVIELFSLICFIAILFNTSFFSIFPLLTYESGRSANFLLLTFINSSTSLNRNYGIFWEPGAFQFFIILSMIIKIFFLKKGAKYIIIDIVCILTTFSSIGVIALFLFILVYFIRYKGFLNRIIQVFLCISISFGMFFLYNHLPNSLKYAYFDKNITAVSGSSENESVSTRQRSVYYTFDVIRKAPILGNGISGFSEYSMNTMTTLNWFARYGLFFGIIMLYGLWNFYLGSKNNKESIIGLFLLTIVATSTEELSLNPAFLIYIMYGLKRIEVV